MFIIPMPWKHDSDGFYCPPRGESTQGIDPLPFSPLTWGVWGHEAWAQCPPSSSPDLCRLLGTTETCQAVPSFPVLWASDLLKGLQVPTMPEWSVPSPEAFAVTDSEMPEETKGAPHDLFLPSVRYDLQD